MFTVLEEKDRQKQIDSRRRAVKSAVVSFQLEGVEPTPEFLALAERYINHEFDGAEFRKLVKQAH